MMFTLDVSALPDWRAIPAPRRAEILYRVAERLRERQTELAKVITDEVGKSAEEAWAEVQEAIDSGYYMAGEGRRCFGITTPSELPNKFAMTVREPVGVVAAITAWNFPIAVPAWKIFPALVLGNIVAWKPSEHAPRCAMALREIFLAAGLPANVLQLFLGDASVGRWLVEHPAVDVVSFTGSATNGREVAATCGRLGKRCALELGGKNAIIVWEDADLELAVDGIIWSAFGTAGQRCTSCSRVIVHEPIREPLTQMLIKRTQQLSVGRLIHPRARERCERYVADAVAAGARRLTDWPVLLDQVTPQMPVAQEEIFGPVCVILPARDWEEAVRINNDVPYGLVSALYTRDVNRAFRAMRELRSGLVYINAGTIGSEVHLPFGGPRVTGNGWREAGPAALDTYSEWKTIYVDFSGRLQRAQMDR
ncbi:MAG: aldehyde dehydrogenase family protein [Verrucomicrobiae bacterium]|nr:aldehyde dehydrogenase family protein [Verrucomicrobiae bacterium]